MVYLFVALLVLLLVLMTLMYRYNRMHHSSTRGVPEPDNIQEQMHADNTKQPQPLRSVPTWGARPPTDGGSIMIVDDQAMIRILLMEVFVASGLEVYEAGNGAEAIRKFEQKPVDLVLLDLKMPEMNGIETLLQLRRIKPDLIAVMISAYGEPLDIENAERLGVTEFFNKPFDIEELKIHVLNQLKGAPL